ncbi:hypothetical protein ACFPLB_15595 [Aquamicrobium segne]|uniref:Uncharacterized protein n=1 Tax=Aquamicrobium segne TaxID=469547 RepID=A0ABW0H424_9HYPH
MATDENRRQQQESHRILKDIAAESASAGAPLAGRAAKKTGDPGQLDPVEDWGMRIGRVLGMALTIGMAIWLIRLIFSNG